jgi:hypothetical protein
MPHFYVFMPHLAPEDAACGQNLPRDTPHPDRKNNFEQKIITLI